MWGLSSNPAWVAHSPVLNLERLRDTALFVSAAQGVPGEIDQTKTSSERIGPPVAIEAASYACSAYFVDKAGEADLDVEWYPLVQGTHSWGLFEKSMRKSWDVIGPTLEVEGFERETPVTKTPLAEDTPQPVGGSSGSSSLRR